MDSTLQHDFTLPLRVNLIAGADSRRLEAGVA
jgi:hypothetical protein